MMKCLFLQLQKKLFFKYSLQYLFLLGLVSSLIFPFGVVALFETGQTISEAKLISSVEGEGDQKTIWMGLDIYLQPGWKTYWRTPGASGYGLKIDWSESQNVQSAKLYWPAPTKFQTFQFIANGYKEEVVFPIQVTLKMQHTPIFLKGKLDYLVCDAANCIPQSKTVMLSLADKPSIPSGDAPKIIAATQHIPEKNIPDLSIKSAQFIQNENATSYLRLIVFHKGPLVSPLIFIEGTQHLLFDKISSINTMHDTYGNTSTIDIPIYKNEKKELVRIPNLIGEKVTLTLESGTKAIEQKIMVTPPPISLKVTFLMYGFALLGGFILNFMPCVLPVILLKIFSLTKYGGGTATQVRKALFLSVAGIVSSFMVLGLITITFSWLGVSLGWGMQFQEPMFLVFMMLILALFTANFWGWYEIILPERVTSLGYEYSEKEGNMGHFLSGMFATLLATPCSAPYLGTAVTFALSRGPFEIMLVFFLLGIGLSLPFILVMIFPKIATYLPKPGKWMNVFKHILGWGFFFTMLWLFYILTSQIPFFVSLFILITIFLLLFVILLHKKFPAYHRAFILSALVVAFIPFMTLFIENMKEKNIIHQQVNMQKNLEIIRSNVKQGKIVFVDVTADWCLTCKINEFLVLNTKNVQNLLKNNKVTFVTIDWTSKDPAVYEYLKSFDRNGIPFYAVYGPHNPYGENLPQILTFATMDKAIKKAK
ncbi:MAG: thioredoxin family protein [Alphaproteobacteria bacterium]|nr:thioredoxin family protein [Alphaproteobacteria bacterium]